MGEDRTLARPPGPKALAPVCRRSMVQDDDTPFATRCMSIYVGQRRGWRDAFRFGLWFLGLGFGIFMLTWLAFTYGFLGRPPGEMFHHVFIKSLARFMSAYGSGLLRMHHDHLQNGRCWTVSGYVVLSTRSVMPRPQNEFMHGLLGGLLVGFLQGLLHARAGTRSYMGLNH